jgi:hypothetical protein
MTSAEFLFEPTPKDMTVGTADLISSNVFDAGSAKKLFGGNSLRPPVLQVGYKITAGTGALSFRVRFVGADNAALTTKPEIIADTGVQTVEPDGQTAFVVGDQVFYALHLQGQRTAKRYYGVITTMGTADQDGEYTAVITEGPQTNMPGRKAAVP